MNIIARNPWTVNPLPWLGQNQAQPPAGQQPPAAPPPAEPGKTSTQITPTEKYLVAAPIFVGAASALGIGIGALIAYIFDGRVTGKDVGRSALLGAGIGLAKIIRDEMAGK